VVALAIAVMIGDGCCAFVSISLGQDEVHRAKQSVGERGWCCAQNNQFFRQKPEMLMQCKSCKMRPPRL